MWIGEIPAYKLSTHIYLHTHTCTNRVKTFTYNQGVLKDGETVFIRKEYANWFSKAKWSALKNKHMHYTMYTEQVVFTFLGKLYGIYTYVFAMTNT